MTPREPPDRFPLNWDAIEQAIETKPKLGDKILALMYAFGKFGAEDAGDYGLAREDLHVVPKDIAFLLGVPEGLVKTEMDRLAGQGLLERD